MCSDAYDKLMEADYLRKVAFELIASEDYKEASRFFKLVIEAKNAAYVIDREYNERRFS